MRERWREGGREGGSMEDKEAARFLKQESRVCVRVCSSACERSCDGALL
jgi:hypothetical protein